MASEVMEQRGVSASTHFFDEIRFPSEVLIVRIIFKTCSTRLDYRLSSNIGDPCV